jgi:hypothetical protein
LEADEGEAGTVGNMLNTVLFLASATNGIAQKLKDLPGFDYGRLKIVDNIFDMPAYVRVSTATDVLMLEFAAPAAKKGAWAKDPQTWPQWKKWKKAVQKRYGIDVHRQGITLKTATDLLMAVNRKRLEAAGHNLSELAMTPLVASMADARIRNYLNASLIDMFHLSPDFTDNPFGWLHARLDPVVESIKKNRGKFIGAVTFFHAINMANLFSGLEETQKDVMLGDRSALERWLPFMDSLASVAEGVINGSALLANSEHMQVLRTRISATTGLKVSVVLGASKELRVVGLVTKLIAKGMVKTIAIAGPILTMWMEFRTINRSLETGHHASVALGSVQFGLSVSLLVVPSLAAIGVFSLGVGVAIGVALIIISVAIGMVQAYIARSRIEDFLSLSFWGNAPTLRYWDQQPRPSSGELLEESRTAISPNEGVEVRRYFEAELDAFYYMLFSPIVRITEHIGVHWDTNRGEHQIMSEMTSFVVYLPGYSDGTCTYSIKLFELDTNWFEKDESKDISDLFDRRKQLDSFTGGVLFRFDHYNHNKCDQLGMLIEYVKDGRKITGESGLRLILNGNDVEELSVDERLAFEM